MAEHDPAKATRPHPAVPGRACDCHVALTGPLALLATAPEPEEIPQEATLSQLLDRLDRRGLERAVLVQPELPGTAGDALLQALAAHRNRLRGVARYAPELGDGALEQMAHTGVRGLRVDLRTPGAPDLPSLEALAQRLEPHRCHLELAVDPAILKRVAPHLATLAVDCVIEHFGLVPAGAAAALKPLVRLLRGGRCWVKLSGIDLVSRTGPPWRDTLPLAQALIEADPTRLLWGSGWPQGGGAGWPPDDAALIDLLALWAPDERLRHLILVDNPARLYRFGD